jgi:transcriptional regulator with XRE-family HTH domain
MNDTPAIGRAPPPAAKEIDRQDLAKRLKEAREYLELSQDEVATALNVPRSAISLIETGQRRVEAVELQRLAAMYQRPIGYFTGEDPEPAALPETVQHLARTAAKLTDRDREELVRFAEFLQLRGRP